MTSLKISALTAGTCKATDLHIAVDTTDTTMAPSGTDKKYTLAQIAAYSGSNITLPASRIGYGDPSNLLTGTADFTWGESTKALTLNNVITLNATSANPGMTIGTFGAAGALIAEDTTSGNFFSNAASGDMCIRNETAGSVLMGTGNAVSQVEILQTGQVNLNTTVVQVTGTAFPYISVGPNGQGGPAIGRSSAGGLFFTNAIPGDMAVRNFSDGRVLLGTSGGTSTITLGASRSINIPAFTTPGYLTNDGSGNITSTPGLSSSNTVYVSVNGTDTALNGSILSPYATVSYAQSQISTASPTNIFTVYVLDGQINDSGQIYATPYINISGAGQQALINNSMDVIPNSAAWSATSTGVCYFTNVGFTNNFTLDFTAVSGPTLCSIFCTNVNILGTYFANGGGSLGGQLFLSNSGSYISTFTAYACNINSQANFYQTSFTAGDLFQTEGTNASCFSDVMVSFEGLSQVFAGPNTVVVLVATNTGGPINYGGSHTIIYADAATIGFNPPDSNITLLDQDTSIASSYSAINFTPTSADVRGMIQGIDNALGSETANLTATYVGYGSGSNALTGTPDFTWTDSSKSLNLNSLITLNSSSALPYITIGPNGGSGPTIGRVATAGQLFIDDAIGDFGIRNYSDGRILLGTSSGNANLILGASGAINIPAFNVAGYLTNDGSGNITSTPTTNASLTATQIGYGNGSNVMTGTSDFTWNEAGNFLSMNTSVEGVRITATDTNPFISIGSNARTCLATSGGAFFTDSVSGDMIIVNSSNILLGSNNFGHSSLKLNGTNQGIEVSTGGILFDNAGSGYVATALNNYAVGSASLVPVTGPWSGNITFWWTINGNTVTLSWAGVTATATANASLTTGNGVIPSYACPVGTKIHQVMGVNGVSSGSFTTICVQVTPAGSIDFSNANAGNFVIGQVVGTAYSEITYNIGPN